MKDLTWWFFLRAWVTPSALVIGGGLAGMTAALAIAGQGFAVTLVEREKSLGGKARLLSADRHGNDPRQTIRDLIAQIKENPHITVLTKAKVAAVSGYVGNFTTNLKCSWARVRRIPYQLGIMTHFLMSRWNLRQIS